MESITLLAQELFMLYGIGLIGYITKRKRILNEHTDLVLTQLILYITLPALILFSLDFPFSSEFLVELSQLILLSGYALTMACIVAYIMYKFYSLPESRAGIYQSLIIFGNQGFIGYAVSYILFAEIGIVYATVFNLLYFVLIWSYCPFLIGKKQAASTWRSMFLSPGILATFIGLSLWFLPFLRSLQFLSFMLYLFGQVTGWQGNRRCCSISLALDIFNK